MHSVNTLMDNFDFEEDETNLFDLQLHILCTTSMHQLNQLMRQCFHGNTL